MLQSLFREIKFYNLLCFVYYKKLQIHLQIQLFLKLLNSYNYKSSEKFYLFQNLFTVFHSNEIFYECVSYWRNLKVQFLTRIQIKVILFPKNQTFYVYTCILNCHVKVVKFSKSLFKVSYSTEIFFNSISYYQRNQISK